MMSVSDIMNIVNNPSIYSCCEQTKKLSIAILSNETITDKNRLIFFSTINNYTEEIIRTAIKYTRDEDMHKLYNCTAEITKDIELCMMNKVKIISLELHKALKFKDDDGIKRNMLLKMEYGKMMLYDSIKNKTTEDTMHILQHCNKTDAYKLYRTLPHLFEYELAISGNMHSDWADYVYDNFEHKDNEEIITKIIDSELMNSDVSKIKKFVHNITKPKLDLSDKLIYKIIALLQIKNIKPVHASDKLKLLMLEYNIACDEAIIYNTVEWKIKLMADRGKKNKLTKAMIKENKSILNNETLKDILSNIKNEENIKCIYKLVNDINNENLDLMLNHCKLYKLLDIRRRKNIPGSLVVKHYHYKNGRYISDFVFDKESASAYLKLDGNPFSKYVMRIEEQ